MKKLLLKTILFALPKVLSFTARKHAAFRLRLKERNCTVYIGLQDGSIGRFLEIRGGRVQSRTGTAAEADVSMLFKDLPTALKFLMPNPDQGEIIHAAKNFKVVAKGPDHLVVWFMQTLNLSQTVGVEKGMAMRDGTRRFTTCTNGGPLFIYVKDGRIQRVTPLELDDKDAASWEIKARGKTFRPHRRALVAPHALSLKSLVYSDKRILTPMKRVDFDPDGERNPQNRGKSGYVPISWDEALTIVAKEINRQKRVHGPGSITFPLSSHHQWGNVGYYLSALMRFANLIGFTRVAANPDSWEGWYWGAMHHFGNSMRIGVPAGYSGVEDCLKEAEMIVFWSCDPESTNGAYAGFEGTTRRLWAKELGIEFVHIDPHFNPTAQLLGGRWLPVRPQTDAALATAIMYVWAVEGLYDEQYVADRTTGFEEWKSYLLGKTDGIAKTPEWQEGETGIPAKDVRALARKWGNRKVYLATGMTGAGFGGAGRGATGQQWARCLIMMMAMQGWGKPGVNFGCLQIGAPVDHHFYFPGYADGGISGELMWNGNAVNNYQRMPHILTMNPVKQLVPRQQLPEAIINGHATGYLWDGISQEAQFTPFTYPMPGYSPIHMIYRYGGSSFGTVAGSGRWVEAYRHDSIEFVVNQSIWMEGEAQFADIILPACTQLERWDIGEWCNSGGYAHHGYALVNHRTIVLQHKCIEPLGESRSDYDIFTAILERLGLGGVFTEGCSELDWVKRVFDSSDLPDHVSWADFCRKGYFVVPAEKPELRQPVDMRWFAEGRPKDVPEPHPLPSQWADEFGKGLQTPSGKLEFIPEILKRHTKDNPERPALNRYIPSWEGLGTTELVGKYPLQMIATHSRYSFHTSSDGKNGVTNRVADHRTRIAGHDFWLLRIDPADAAARGIAPRDLVKVYNDRGAVICAADVSALVAPGVVKSYEASAEFQLLEVAGDKVEIGGCMNILTPNRPQTKGTGSMSPNSCLVQIEKWQGAEAFARLQAATGVVHG
ncbi:MAG: pyrogallol hydroxytransferase large subunit [Betaproteobacteria bacterium HGW-Betaproteobacteria-7]|jgi:trimethylamine-N-oxide reductase (cytochrome c)|nr:MAG: pyrogallol hydroxytransferase large subunit [Betaproteobacteria bacterium HGW-Betaproteobacteria-7]